MNGFTARLVFLTVFIAGLAYFLYRDRDKIGRKAIFFYRRTEKGVGLINRIEERFPRFWKVYGYMAAVSGVLSTVFATVFIGDKVIKAVQAGSAAKSGVSAILPSLSGESSFQAGVSFIPVEYWLIGLATVMTFHELSHGIVARSEDFNIRSVGWFVLGIFPGAFVEPEGEKMLPDPSDDSEIEEDLEGSTAVWDQGNLFSRIKVLGAGSFANFVIGAILFTSIIAFSAAATQPSNIVYAAQQGYPAAEAGMDNGTLYSVNGNRLGTDLKQLQTISAGEQVTLNTSEGVFTVEAVKENSSTSSGISGFFSGEDKEADGRIGIMVGTTTDYNPGLKQYSGLLNWFISLLSTVAAIHIGIGLVNMLPFRPLDGGHIVGGIVDKYLGEKASKLFNMGSLLGMIGLIGLIVLSALGV
ncbi:MAG: site-2 protease family protein [Candidatus Nanohalobium sp.]